MQERGGKSPPLLPAIHFGSPSNVSKTTSLTTFPEQTPQGDLYCLNLEANPCLMARYEQPARTSNLYRVGHGTILGIRNDSEVDNFTGLGIR